MKRKPQFKVGDRVILGRHTRKQNWTPEMDQYVGRIARIKKIYFDIEEFPVANVDIDCCNWYWRLANMKHAKSLPQNTRFRATQSGQWSVKAKSAFIVDVAVRDQQFNGADVPLVTPHGLAYHCHISEVLAFNSNCDH
jgi:hypothetical protein